MPRQTSQLRAGLQASSGGAAEVEPAAKAGAAEPERGPVCNGLMSTEAISKITPPAEMWANLRQTAAAAWAGQRVDPTKVRRRPGAGAC